MCNLAGMNGIASAAVVARSASAVVARSARAGGATRGVLGMTGSPSKHHRFHSNVWVLPKKRNFTILNSNGPLMKMLMRCVVIRP